MAIIPLRQYNREIEGLIETGQLDEAVAHCRHILETFPKYMATYRLLGKAHLEQQRFGDAADIFQRVLSSVPDDFMAHVGMSIIREDEGNLDAAIWYMERASEAQPANAAIRDELRRLHGRRDGIEPPKVRLTRGALARMYAKGGLFEQAIGELRGALAEDPQRPDLQVMLAQMYFQLGQQVEAIDTCGALVKRMPYCLVANRILALILSQKERQEDTRTYQQRVIALDPYFISAPATALTADAVADATVTIDHLNYSPGQAAGKTVQPAWAASLGIAFDEKPEDQLPEWLQETDLGASKPVSNRAAADAHFSWEDSERESPSDEEILAHPEQALPDWMKEAGWTPSSGNAIEAPGAFDMPDEAGETSEDLAKADIPEWLKNMAPAEEYNEEIPPDGDKQQEQDVPWLQKRSPGASDTIVNWLGKKKSTPETEAEAPAEPTASDHIDIDNVPDWMKELNLTGDAAAQKPEMTPEVPLGPTDEGLVSPEALAPEAGETPEQPVENVTLPDWLSDVDSSQESSGITDWLNQAHLENAPDSRPISGIIPDTAVPDWLREIQESARGTKDLSLTEAEQAELPAPVEQPAAVEAEIPDWLKEMGEAEAEVEETALPEPAAEQPAAVEAEIPDWLKEMGEAEAEVEEISLPEPAAEQPAAVEAEIPDWLKEMGEAEAEVEELALPEPAAETPASIPSEAPEWLQEIDETSRVTKDLYMPEPVIEEPTKPEEDFPDWLMHLGEATPHLDELAPPELPEEAHVEIGSLEWHREIDEDARVTKDLGMAEPSLELPEEPEAGLPDWLKEIIEPAAAVEEAALPEPVAEETPATEIELPDWLKEMEEAEEPVEGISLAEPAAEALVEPEAMQAEEPSEADEFTRVTQELALPEPVVEEQAAPATELPDWLQEMGEAEPVEEVITPTEPGEEVPPAIQAELPDWLQEMAEPEQVTEAASAPETTPQAPLPPVDLSDQDAALAWLESLAAQHGAKEEELITPPEERLDVMPDWIKSEAEESLPVPEIPAGPALEAPEALAEALPDWLTETAEVTPTEEHLPEEPVVTEPTPAEEELPDWLKAMHDLPMTSAEIPVAQPGAEIPPTPAEELPDWLIQLRETSQPQEEAPTPIAEVPSEQFPDWLIETAGQPKITEEMAEKESAELPEWLKEIDKEIPTEVEPFAITPTPEAPAWMPEAILPEPAVVEPEAEPLEPIADTQPRPVISEPEPAEVLPEAPQIEAVNINTASLSELEHLGIGFVDAQSIIAHRETHGDFATLEELQGVVDLSPQLFEELGDRLTTGLPSEAEEAAPVVETEETILASARQLMDAGEIEPAIEHYSRLINQRTNLEAIIPDLEEATYRHPVDFNIWQVLGDAYLRKDALQEALDAYTKAEELLR